MPRSLSAITFSPTGDTNISRSAADQLFTADDFYMPGRLGVGQPPATAFSAWLFAGTSHTSGSGTLQYGARLQNNWTPAVDASSIVRGAVCLLNYNVGTGITHTNAATDAVVSLLGQVSSTGAGTSTAALTAVAGQVNQSAAGSLSGVRTLFAMSPTIGAGTVANAYGVRIDAQKVTNVTTGYGVYQAGSTDLNYFNGNVGLGQTVPTAKLHFAADTVAAGGILFGTDTNLYRSAADVLRTDDAMAVGPYLAVGTSPAATGDVRLPSGGTVLVTSGSLNLGVGAASILSVISTGAQLGDGRHLIFGTGSGSKLGTATTQKLAFWNSTPVVQNAGWSATAGYTATRTFNPEATSVTELARVVGTLVDTLKTYGLLGA
jgi:hypothetical protein